jgi:F420-non-reducing hydrogenase iron-sulfur subunit
MAQATHVQPDAAATAAAWQPRIVAFLCYWCSYTGADNAGTARLKYPPNVDIVRGADGVMVCGCHIGDCHYISGNHKTMARMPLLGRTLAGLGLEDGRFVHEWVSAAEGEKFAKLVRQVVEQVRALGPLDWPGRLRERGVGHGMDLEPWREHA